MLKVSIATGADGITDLAVPVQVRVAELLRHLVSGSSGPLRLVTATGRELDPGATLVDQGVRDGDFLALADGEEGPVIRDDPAEALAEEVHRDVLAWDPSLLRPAALLCAVLLLGLAGAGLVSGPSWCGGVAGAAAVLLGAAARLAHVRLDDRLAALVAGWVAAGFAAVSGWQLGGGAHAGAAAAVTALVLARCLGRVGVLLLPAAVAGAALGGIGLVAVPGGPAPGFVASVALVLVLLAVPTMPGLTLTLAGARAAPARELFRAVLVAAGVLVVVLGSVAAAHSAAGAALAGAVCLVTLCRCGRHHGAVEVLICGVSGVVGLLAVGVTALVVHPGLAGGVGGVSLGMGLLFALAGGMRPGDPPAGAGGLRPRVALVADRCEALLLLAVVPLLALVGGALPAVRSLVER